MLLVEANKMGAKTSSGSKTAWLRSRIVLVVLVVFFVLGITEMLSMFFWPSVVIWFLPIFLLVLYRFQRLLIALGLVLLALSGFLFFNVHSFVSQATITDGIIVVPNSDDHNSGISSSWRTVSTVSFQTGDGEATNFSHDDFWYTLHVGDKVTVLYNPEHPSGAKIDSWPDLWGRSLLTLALGCVALVLEWWPRGRKIRPTGKSP